MQTTVREANDRGFECLVLSDCIDSYFPEFYEMTLKMVKAQGGIFGWVGESRSLLPALARVAGRSASRRKPARRGSPARSKR